MDKTRVYDHILTKLPLQQPHWHSGTSPGVVNPGSVFRTQAPIQGASCASWMACQSGLDPRAGCCKSSLFAAFLFVVLARPT